MESLRQQRIDWVLENGSDELVRGLEMFGNHERILRRRTFDSKELFELVLWNRLPATSDSEALLLTNYTTDEIFGLLAPFARNEDVKGFYNFFYYGIIEGKAFGVRLQDLDKDLLIHNYTPDRLSDLVIGRDGPEYLINYERRNLNASWVV